MRFFSMIAALMCVAISTPDASAQTCFEHLRDFDYAPTNCEAIESIDRVFRLQQIRWNSHDYLFVDEGNELKVFNIDNPRNPTATARSHFNVPNFGDSDYDMLNFSVCDDCRFGVANFKSATVLFDLGTGTTPRFEAVHKNSSATQVMGAYTFAHDGQQYLVAAGLGAENACPRASGLYEFNGIDEDGNLLLECIDGNYPEITNGIFVGNTTPPIIYMSNRYTHFGIYRLRTSPTFGLDYLGDGGVGRADMSRGYGVSVDEENGLMAAAHQGVLTIYDIGYGTGSPASPILLATKTLTTLTTANRVALHYPIVHVGQKYSTATPMTFDLSDPTEFVPLDQGFWDPSQPWNDVGTCVWNNHALFSADGSTLYLSRYSVLQLVDPTACAVPIEPTASLHIEPQSVYPGDAATVTNTSTGGDRFAIWITDGPDAHASGVVSGSTSFGASTSHSYTVPLDVAMADAFWAHAAVETDEYPYVPGSTPSQIRSRQININRTPGVASTAPHQAWVGDTATLEAVAQGHADTYQWQITPPVGPVTTRTGRVVDLSLDAAGDWQLQVTATYLHEAPDGSSYRALATGTVDVQDAVTELDIAWSPIAPQVGERVIFAIEGTPNGVDEAHWDFGAPGCSAPQTTVCIPGVYTDCMLATHEYAVAGPATVRLSVVVGGVTFEADPRTITLGPGDCGAPCTYALSATSFEFGANGGTDTVSVTTESGCSWEAVPNAAWISIVSPAAAAGSGAGSGNVIFGVAAYDCGSEDRRGSLVVAGQHVAVTQVTSGPCAVMDGGGADGRPANDGGPMDDGGPSAQPSDAKPGDPMTRAPDLTIAGGCRGVAAPWTALWGCLLLLWRRR